MAIKASSIVRDRTPFRVGTVCGFASEINAIKRSLVTRPSFSRYYQLLPLHFNVIARSTCTSLERLPFKTD